ncbi:formylglycine-generating enzyme family protein [Marivita sp. S0852]|uniref:formylglycine-generating enzyme family protein n=1 Tax=Marivita sp. S0852 TaxID=3373893 RepID=UPI0039828936
MTLSKTSLRFVGLGLVVAALAVGGALMQRGPDPSLDPSLAPEMAEQSVTLPDGSGLWVQRHEVTVAEWNACASEQACSLTLRVRAGFDAETTPATGLSYVDVQEYITWLNARTGQSYRLPTTDEWNHIAAPVLPKDTEPLFTDPSLTWASTYLTEGTAPRALKTQGSFSTSPEGIADLDGSVWEWTSDCYADGMDANRCPAFYLGGEHVAAMSFLVRDPARGGCAVGTPPAHLGLRLVTDS